jgi:hypothetical protein
MLDAIGPRRIHATAMLLAVLVLSLVLTIPAPEVVAGLVAAGALVVLGVHVGGAESLDGVFTWLVLPHRAVFALVQGEEYEAPGHARAQRRAEHATHIATILAGGSVASADGGLRQHRIGKASADDGSIGWWVEVPEGAGVVQVRVQASPTCAVALHVGAGSEWIAAAGPAAPVLVHRMELPAGQAYLRASVADAIEGGAQPVVELWVEPAPAGVAAAPRAA